MFDNNTDRFRLTFSSRSFLSFLGVLFCLSWQGACSLTPIFGDPARSEPVQSVKNLKPDLQPKQVLTLLLLSDIDRSSSANSLENYQFGTIQALRVAPIEHTFILRNNNPTPVFLDRLQPSCGCTTAVAGAAKTERGILPGKTLQVHVSIDPGHLSAGPITKTVWVYIKGQSDAAATLQMIGTMRAAVTFSPTFLDFGRVDRGSTPFRLLTMTLDPQLAVVTAPLLSLSSQDIKISQEPELTAKAAKAKRTVFTYRLTLTPTAHLGEMNGLIALAPPSDGSALIHALQAVSVPIMGEVVGELSASPSAVVFGTVTQGQAATLHILLTATSADALHNLSVRSLTPSISVGLTGTPIRQQNGATLPLTSLQRVLDVTAEPALSVGSLQTQVIVTTGHHQELVLPVFVSVASSGH